MISQTFHKLESTNREWVEGEKERERTKVEKELEVWKQRQGCDDGGGDADCEDEDGSDERENGKETMESAVCAFNQPTSDAVDGSSDAMEEKIVTVLEKEAENIENTNPNGASVNWPPSQHQVKPDKSKEIFPSKKEVLQDPIRNRGSIKVTFTARHFPTPTRESLAHEEAEVRMGKR